MQNVYGSIEFQQREAGISSPFQLVLMAYDLAILACKQQDFDRAARTIRVLRDALNYEYEGAAVELFRQYQWCLDCLRKEDYTSTLATVSALRQAWENAEKPLNPADHRALQASLPVLVHTP